MSDESNDGHVRAECKDKNCLGNCMLCNLYICDRCHGGEGCLPSECPGEVMTGKQSTDVYEGRLDYRGGKWVAECSPHSPEAYRDVRPGDEQP